MPFEKVINIGFLVYINIISIFADLETQVRRYSNLSYIKLFLEALYNLVNGLGA